MKCRVVLLGPPASGKGTQASLIHAKYGFPVTSPGAMLREEKKAGTALGHEADELTSQGKLLPDSIIVGLVKSWLEKQDSAFVFDGFPRTVGQASALERLLEERGSTIDAVIALEADREILEERVVRRVMCTECGGIFRIGQHVSSISEPCPACGGTLTKRRDDTPEILASRLAEYSAKTLPLIAHYSDLGILHRVESTSTPELVFSQIRAILEGQ